MQTQIVRRLPGTERRSPRAPRCRLWRLRALVSAVPEGPAGPAPAGEWLAAALGGAGKAAAIGLL